MISFPSNRLFRLLPLQPLQLLQRITSKGTILQEKEKDVTTSLHFTPQLYLPCFSMIELSASTKSAYWWWVQVVNKEEEEEVASAVAGKGAPVAGEPGADFSTETEDEEGEFFSSCSASWRIFFGSGVPLWSDSTNCERENNTSDQTGLIERSLQLLFLPSQTLILWSTTYQDCQHLHWRRSKKERKKQERTPISNDDVITLLHCHTCSVEIAQIDIERRVRRQKKVSRKLWEVYADALISSEIHHWIQS